MIHKFGRVYVLLTSLATHLGFGVWYLYERQTCDPTELLGCLSASLIPTMFTAMVGLLATLTVVVLLVDAGLYRYYTGDER